MYTYVQLTGNLFRDGELLGKGYAGRGGYKNNPAAERLVDEGPIPRGRWQIGKPYHHPKLGPLCFDLTPLPGTDTLGRSAFRLHADSIHDPGNASEGCIVQARNVRQLVADKIATDDLLQVISGLAIGDIDGETFV